MGNLVRFSCVLGIGRTHVFCFPGQLETTLFKRFCMNQRLRGIISTFGLNSSLEKLVTAFTQHFGSKQMGTLMSNMRAFESPQAADRHQPMDRKKLDPLISKLLQAYEERMAEQGTIKRGLSNFGLAGTNAPSWRQVIRLGIKHDKFSQYGVSFSTFNCVPKDSYVAIGRKVPDDWHAGHILSIFTYTHKGPTLELEDHTETYFVVQKYEELTRTDATHDPYRKVPFIGGRLYYDRVKGPELVTQEEILCHLALTPFKHPSIASPCIHTLPLDRVC